MAKFEETGAAVGAMLPVTPVSEVLTKTPTVESVDNEYAALKLTNTDDSNNNTTPDVELPDNIPPADDPMNPGFANPEEAPATPEEIEEVKKIEAIVESYRDELANMNDDEEFTEGANADIRSKFKTASKVYKDAIKQAKTAMVHKNYEEAMKYAKTAKVAISRAKSDIQKIDSGVAGIILGFIIDEAIVDLQTLAITLQDIAVKAISNAAVNSAMGTKGGGIPVKSYPKWNRLIIQIRDKVKVLRGIKETYKEKGFTPEMLNMYKQKIVGSISTMEDTADRIIKQANEMKSKQKAVTESASDTLSSLDSGSMESYFADVEIGKPYTESVDSEKGDVMTEDVYPTGMSSAERSYLESGMDEIAKLSRDAGINDYAKNNGDFYVAESAQSEFFTSGENEMFTEGADSEHNPNIDDDIKPIIKMLNEKGYKTIASCSGHPSARRKDDRYRDGIRYGKLYSGARIVFDKDYDLPNVPEGWTKKTMEEDHRIGIYVVAPRFKIIDGLPEKNYTNWKRRYMRSLEKWAKELPKVGEVKETGDKLTLESVLYDISVDAMVGE